ncbi:MAG: response regulator transcription factor [Candidatus Nanopelagicales bacterium]
MILLIEDDAALARALSLSLSARGYQVRAAATAAEGLRGLTGEVDIILLDLGLPDRDGVDLLRDLRATSAVPVIVLSARADRHEKVRALDNGADDYVTKPFDLEELLARVRAATRRATRETGAPVIETPDFAVDLAAKTVTRTDGSPVHLTPTEWGLVEALVKRPGMVVTGEDLLHDIWGPGYQSETHYLRVYLSQVRKKLEPDPQHPRYFLTSPGIGYRFQPE